MHLRMTNLNGIHGLGSECKFVNDHLFLGKSREEIAQFMANSQGIPLSQALADPSIALYTDPTYRARMCAGGDYNLNPVTITTPLEEGGSYTIQKSVGTLSSQDAMRMASQFGATAQPEVNLLGQQTGNWTLLFPNGARVNAEDVARLYAGGTDPYTVNQQVQSWVNSSAGQDAAYQRQQQVVQESVRAASQVLPVQTYVGFNPVTGATMKTPTPVPVITNAVGSGSPGQRATDAAQGVIAAAITNQSGPTAPRASVTGPGVSPAIAQQLSNMGTDLKRLFGFGTDRPTTVNGGSSTGDGESNWLLWVGLAAAGYFLFKGK